MQERKTRTASRGSRGPAATTTSERFAVNRRHAVAGGSPATAIERRSAGDRRSTVRVAWESHAESHAAMETTARPPPRPPPQNDTLALASSRPTRRLGGGRTRPASGRAVAPAPCAAASRPRSGSMRPASSGPPRVPCFHPAASGVSVPAGTPDAEVSAARDGSCGIISP